MPRSLRSLFSCVMYVQALLFPSHVLPLSCVLPTKKGTVNGISLICEAATVKYSPPHNSPTLTPLLAPPSPGTTPLPIPPSPWHLMPPTSSPISPLPTPFLSWKSVRVAWMILSSQLQPPIGNLNGLAYICLAYNTTLQSHKYTS